MVESTPWKWNMVSDDADSVWKTPAIESYYLLHRWKSAGMTEFLDLGCGLGRHSILMASHGLNARSYDISEDAVERTRRWAESEGLKIDCRVGDMLSLPYDDGSIDCIICRNVISHTDTEGVKKAVSEIRRVLRVGGECYVTLASKSDWGYNQGWPQLDENTRIRLEKGPEYMIPHFYTDYDLTYKLFDSFDILDLQHIQTFYEADGDKRYAYHYHALCRRRE